MTEAAGLGLTGVLAAHGEVWDDVAMYGWSCKCGWGADDDMRRSEDEYRAHVAEEVRTWFRAALTSPEVVELTEAERSTLGCHCWHTEGVWSHKRGCYVEAAETLLANHLAAVAETLGAK